jgi:hypothetical protein
MDLGQGRYIHHLSESRGIEDEHQATPATGDAQDAALDLTGSEGGRGPDICTSRTKHFGYHVHDQRHEAFLPLSVGPHARRPLEVHDNPLGATGDLHCPQMEPSAHVDHRDQLATKVGHSDHFARRMRQTYDRKRIRNLAHPVNPHRVFDVPHDESYEVFGRVVSVTVHCEGSEKSPEFTARQEWDAD